MAANPFSNLASVFTGPDIAGPVTGGLTQGYNLAMPYLNQWQQYINQLYPQAAGAVTQFGTQALAPQQQLWGQFAPAVSTYMAGLTGKPGQTPFDVFRQSPMFQSALDQAQKASAAAEARGGTTGSGNALLEAARQASDYTS